MEAQYPQRCNLIFAPPLSFPGPFPFVSELSELVLFRLKRVKNKFGKRKKKRNGDLCEEGKRTGMTVTSWGEC